MPDDRPRLLLALLLLYLFGRGLQPFFDHVPALLIVVLHVLPPALFTLLHGAHAYGWRGILVFTGLCLGIASFFESLSLQTGFPFGHYHFTDLMGPKLFDLPILLALAYVGMGYLAWIVAVSILNLQERPFSRIDVLRVSLLASLAMTTWDVSMDPVWADIDNAWVWHDGGAYFGVPISNFLGWLLTTFVFYIAFAIYVRRGVRVRTSASADRLAIFFYGISAVGNLLVVAPPSLHGLFMDATGKTWMVANILWACRIVSLLVMLPIGLLAHARTLKQPARESLELDVTAN